MTEQIFIKKIKVKNDNTAEIQYTTSDDLGKGNITFTGDQQITGEFKRAFQNTVEGFIGCMPLLSKDKTKITMDSIKFEYDASGQLQKALYSVKYAFATAKNAVTNIDTPLLPIYKEDFDDKTFCISGKHEDELYEIIDFAKKYLQGQTRTEQMKLEVVNND